jgi:hypothetical protein
MKTNKGKLIAEKEAEYIREFRTKLIDEISGD